MSEASGTVARGVILQLSPNDHPPFPDICAVYKAAGESLGCLVATIFFSPPVRGDSVDWAEYLNVDKLADTKLLVHSLDEKVGTLDVSVPMLAICHRYRTYRALRSSSIEAGRVVVLAHEFGFFKRFRRRVERKIFSRDFLFAGVSPAVQAELSQTVERPLCLSNGIDQGELAALRQPREAALAELHLQSGPFTVGILGRLIPLKRPELAVQAIAELVGRIPHVRLVIIGDGQLKEQLEEMTRDLPVTLTGFVPDAKRLLSALDVLLIVSNEREAFGMVALEAMASGVPVVAGQVSGPESVLGSVGFYYPQATPEAIADCLEEIHGLQQTGGLAERMQRGIERTSREFSVTAVARRLDDIFFQMT